MVVVVVVVEVAGGCGWSCFVAWWLCCGYCGWLEWCHSVVVVFAVIVLVVVVYYGCGIVVWWIVDVVVVVYLVEVVGNGDVRIQPTAQQHFHYVQIHSGQTAAYTHTPTNT